VNRRSFLGFLGLGAAAVAAEQVIPFNRVWSFPKTIVPANAILLPPGASIRYMRAWNTWHARLLTRIDILQGFGELAFPVPEQQLESGRQWHNASGKPLVWRPPEDVPSIAVAKLRELADERRHLGDRQIFGIHFDEYPHEAHRDLVLA
jgi:hypothetical protein